MEMIFKCFPSLGSLHTQCHLEHRCFVFLQNVPCVTAVASVVLAQYSAADLRSWRWTLRFSSKSSIIIALLHRCFWRKLFTSVWDRFYVGCEGGFQLNSFTYRSSSVSTVCWKDRYSCEACYSRVHRSTLGLSIWLYRCISILIPHYFDYCCFEVCFKIRKCEFLSFLFFSNSILDVLGPLQLHLHFKSVHQFLQRYHVNEILKRFYQNCTNLRVLTSLYSLPTHEHRNFFIYFYFFHFSNML